jgi:hypothetical protein
MRFSLYNLSVSILLLFQGCNSTQELSIELDFDHNFQKNDSAVAFRMEETESLEIILADLQHSDANILQLHTDHGFYWMNFSQNQPFLMLDSNSLSKNESGKSFSGFHDGKYLIILGRMRDRNNAKSVNSHYMGKIFVNTVE